GHDDLATISRRILQSEFTRKTSAIRAVLMQIDSEPAVSELLVLLDSILAGEDAIDGLLHAAQAVATCGDLVVNQGDWRTFARLRLELAAYAYLALLPNLWVS
ncbi:MAG: hypothetical protein LC749_10875, partial [Actinobacteria bacterium]|nr:hypothetical protein [Actinomycetota bacterium]